MPYRYSFFSCFIFCFSGFRAGAIVRGCIHAQKKNVIRTENADYFQEPAIGSTARKKEGILAYAELPVFHNILHIFLMHLPALHQAGEEGTVGCRHAALRFEQRALYAFFTGFTFPLLPALSNQKHRYDNQQKEKLPDVDEFAHVGLQ